VRDNPTKTGESEFVQLAVQAAGFEGSSRLVKAASSFSSFQILPTSHSSEAFAFSQASWERKSSTKEH
jgi:hypothetical protein